MESLLYKGPFSKTMRSCFTLLELLVVIAIISMLVAIMLPTLQSVREDSRRTQCASNMRQIGMAFRMYQDDYQGRYPYGFLNNSDNWQSYLCEPQIRGTYLPTNWVTWDPVTTAKRFQAKFLCPTMVNTYKISGNHNMWGYCFNGTRCDISYGASGWPWNKQEYQNADLNALYQKQSSYAVLTDGNYISYNSDNDWDAFTVADIYDWPVQKVHKNISNTLFMDGHIEAIDVASAANRSRFNQAWYGGVPTSAVNPWFNY